MNGELAFSRAKMPGVLNEILLNITVSYLYIQLYIYIRHFKIFSLQEFGEKKIFPGNTDVSSVVKNFLSVPTAMQKLRIYPESWNNEIALRIELYSNRMSLLIIFNPYFVL